MALQLNSRVSEGSWALSTSGATVPRVLIPHSRPARPGPSGGAGRGLPGDHREREAFLERNGRVSLRTLKLEFGLNYEQAEELVDLQQVATLDGKILSWVGPASQPDQAEPRATASIPEPGARRTRPSASTPKTFGSAPTTRVAFYPTPSAGGSRGLARSRRLRRSPAAMDQTPREAVGDVS
jgi:hypothetical protein